MGQLQRARFPDGSFIRTVRAGPGQSRQAAALAGQGRVRVSLPTHHARRRSAGALWRKQEDSRDLPHGIVRAMNKKPQTFAATFQSIFTTRVLIIIVGALLGMIASRLITM
jgi:hypothetical protein